MRKEGFADDGLFDQMKPFFLPLTMVPQDIQVTESQWAQLEENLIAKLDSLHRKSTQVDSELARVAADYYEHCEKLMQLKNSSTTQATTNSVNLVNNHREWESLPVQQQIDDSWNRINEIDPRRNQLRSELDKLRIAIHDIQTALQNRKVKSTDSELIKPYRGFIMYGPPGEYCLRFN